MTVIKKRKLVHLLLGLTAGLQVLPATPARADLTLEERIDCRRAIEEVYWRHRIWPAENPGAKPELTALLPEERLRALVEDDLRAMAALAEQWHRPLEQSQLRAEVERMARETRSPALLEDLFEALGRDRERVGECLARPLLAQRLARSWYARDPELHRAVRLRAAAELARAGGDLRSLAGFHEVEWQPVDESAVVSLGGEPPAPSQPGDSLAELAGWLGEEAARSLAELPLGRPGPLQEESERFFAVSLLEVLPDGARLGVAEWPKRLFADWLAEMPAVLPAALGSGGSLPEIGGGCSEDSWLPVDYRPEARAGHRTLWTGAEMVVWSRQNGHLYDPATDRWRPMNRHEAPADGWETAVWTGTEMIVWGGGDFLDRFGGGGRWNPLTDTWQPTAEVGAPEPRSLHTAVWTGSEMIIWGGDGEAQALGNGFRYLPDSDTWVEISAVGAPSARHSHRAVWTGSEMIVWGGQELGVLFADGGRYDPLTDGWQAVATAGAPAARIFESTVWAGDRMVVWGGCVASICSTPSNTGGAYDPLSDSWAPTATSGAPSGRRFHSAAWTGSEMFVWGGCTNHDCSIHTSTGGRYDPATDSWTPTSIGGAPTPRSLQSAAWTGSEVIVWGGCTSGECQFRLRDGGRYDPASDSWVPVDTLHPSARINHTAVWTGAEMIVWGGFDGIVLRTGSRYSPALNDWIPMSSSPGGIDARDKHTAVWTGSEMIMWGGSAFGLGTVRSGGRYDPVTDSWTETELTTAPERRQSHQAAWTGTEMLVWGGCSFENCVQMRDSGGLYDPFTDSWRPTTLVDAPSGRAFHSGVWTGSELLVWGGWDGSTQVGDGARYDPALDDWGPMAAAGAPTARQGAPAVWTGSEMILWGGRDDLEVFASGGRYDPVSDAWQPTTETGAPQARYLHVAEWTGSEMVVWSGCEAANGCWDRDPLGDGARYDPVTDSWSAPLSRRFAPPARKLARSVWSGDEMIVWGGQFANEVDDGGRYCPQAPNASIFSDGFESGDTSAWSASVP